MLVKKYSNRRLYDTQASRYITLEELTERIRAGADVRVVDAQDNSDLTQATLTQIILESRGGAKLLPTPVLVRLIRMGDDALAEFFGRYVAWALDVYLAARQGARALMPFNPMTAMFNPWGMPGSSPMSPMSPPPPVTAPPEPEVTAPEEPKAEEIAGDVAALRRELEELRRQMQPKKRKKS